jgi:transcription-repair coupling factor (superfamily II helicase)
VDVGEAEGPFAAVMAAEASRVSRGTVLVVVPTDQEADAFGGDLSFFGTRPIILPWWRTAAYRPASPRAHVFGERAACLSRLCLGDAKVVVASQRAFVTPVPPRDAFAPLAILLEKGGSIDPTTVGDRLSSYGYLRVPRVSLPGEFALRGEVLDLFMPGDEDAVRIVFEYDRIEKIATFDPGLQSSSGALERIAIRPMKELLWDEGRIASLAAKMPLLPGMDGREGAILEELAEKGEAKGEELFYPLAFEKPGSVLDYLGPGSTVIFIDHERLEAQEDTTRKEYHGLYRRALQDGPVPPPEQLLHSFSALESSVLSARALGPTRVARSFALKDSDASARIAMGVEQPRSFFGNVQYFKDELATLIKAGYGAIIFAETDMQAERIAALLKEFEVEVEVADLSAGFVIPSLKLLVVQENEIFGRRRHQPKSLKTTRSVAIDTFVELSPGDFVVHVNYGIGRFAAIERMKVLGLERDYIKIEYAESEVVFVPIEQANLVQRYIGNEGEAPRLDRLGSKSWETRKAKVKASVAQLAERLIRIYARRRAARGYAFPPDTDWQLAFEAAFPYDETVDQIRCIGEVKADMESDKPMDRLICGDVGYGKTEIAMRAIFKAAVSGKQVAFLAPTTILAEQHFENFRERVGDYPVHMAMLSRLVERKTQRGTLADLKEGRLDVVIGTHRLLQKDVEFRNLGLLVVDEEQRFGVKDKERLKEIKASVDCLTLTATPIPRTLDMSVLNTPPINRHPIETVVEEFDSSIIAEAIRKEVARGGQVFYLHNRIESLQEIQAFLQTIVPEVIVETAHGQLDSSELEDIMHRFIHGGFHVLVSTTIIENGIDIPNVNTIVIDRADMYGISQLYQLRGRVGRSDRVAYAYLFYPDKRALSELAMKRLQIISDFTELGSGFKIAMKDLEVRGAGNLLGREQSGDIYAVGFELYLKLLDDAVARLSDAGYEAEEDSYLELEYAGYIPDSYVSLPTMKMEVYKKIASIMSQADLDVLYQELADRFGPLPEEVLSLLSLAEIRVICRRLSIASLKERGGTVTAEFSKVAKVSVERLLRLIREGGGRIKLDPHRPNVLLITTGNIGLREKSEFIRERLASLLNY